MSIYSQIKEQVSTRDVAEYYGYKVGKNGMMCCPFHPDKTPSMKVDARYHCFGCGADGDVISFVQELFELRPYEAAVKLAEDFGIPLEATADHKGKSPGLRHKKNLQSFRTVRSPDPEAALRKWADDAVKTLTEYSWLLREWKETYAPASPDDEWHPLFCEALQNETMNEYDLDILMFGSRDELRDFYKYDRKVVDKVERRIREYREQEQADRTAGSCRTDIGSGSGCDEPDIG